MYPGSPIRTVAAYGASNIMRLCPGDDTPLELEQPLIVPLGVDVIITEFADQKCK